jgi:hypothetical protein
MTRPARVTPAATPLYVTDSALGALVMGERAREWPAAALVLERHGLPRNCPLMGGRYWPAVKAFLDRYNGVGETAEVTDLSQQENWNASSKRRARS